MLEIKSKLYQNISFRLYFVPLSPKGDGLYFFLVIESKPFIGCSPMTSERGRERDEHQQKKKGRKEKDEKGNTAEEKQICGFNLR